MRFQRVVGWCKTIGRAESAASFPSRVPNRPSGAVSISGLSRYKTEELTGSVKVARLSCGQPGWYREWISSPECAYMHIPGFYIAE